MPCYQPAYRSAVPWIIYLQLLLMYCPLVYLLYFCATAVYYRSRIKMQCKKYVAVSSEDDDLLSPLRDSWKNDY
jgi:hypothetical protein